VARPGESADAIEHEACRRYDTAATLRQMEDYGSQPYGWTRAHHIARKRGQDPDSGTDGEIGNEAYRRDDDEEEEHRWHEPSMYTRHRGGREIDLGYDPAEDIRHPDHRRGYRYERMKHPDWDHQQLAVYVNRRLMGDRHAYDPERIAEERRASRYAKQPHRSDGCGSCQHYVPYLTDARAGCCAHEAHHGKQVLHDQICRLWER
jgi:hypothetical protein